MLASRNWHTRSPALASPPQRAHPKRLANYLNYCVYGAEYSPGDSRQKGSPAHSGLPQTPMKPHCRRLLVPVVFACFSLTALLHAQEGASADVITFPKPGGTITLRNCVVTKI